MRGAISGRYRVAVSRSRRSHSSVISRKAQKSLCRAGRGGLFHRPSSLPRVELVEPSPVPSQPDAILLNGHPTPSDNTVYPSTVCICICICICICTNICMMCCCPASRANFSVTYAHVAVHPQEQVGRLTSRLPNFSGQIVMLRVTLMIVVLPSNGTLTLNRPKFPPLRRKVYL
jgi:hypothetical protein